jgi:two-component system, LytTR family, response regulator AlgR
MANERLFSVLVADDEPLARDRLCSLLRELRDEKAAPIGEIRLADDGLSAFEEIRSLHEGARREGFDEDDDEDGFGGRDVIAFLDIRMPRMDGLELARHLSRMRRAPIVVFCTAHEEHAIDAFELSALDYLLKPARKERLLEVFGKIERLSQAALLEGGKRPLSDLRIDPDRAERMAFANTEARALSKRTHLSISERGKIRLIPLEEVLYFRSELKYTTIKTLNKEYLTEEPLVNLEKEFPDEFLRIHRNCLIPRAKLRGFERNRMEESGWVAIIDGLEDKLPVSRRQWAAIREKKIF